MSGARAVRKFRLFLVAALALTAVSLVSTPAAAATATDCLTGTVIQPGTSIQSAINAAPTGQTICLAPGTHRIKTQLWPKADQSFVGLPGAIVSGSEVISFQPQGRLWVSPAHTQQPVSAPANCAAAAAGTCNMPFRLFVNGTALKPAGSFATLTSGTYYFDLATDNVYMADDPTGKTVELGIAALGMSGTKNNVPADGVDVSGITWQHFANERNGVISTFAAKNWTITGNEVRYSHDCGIWSGTGTVVSGNYVHHMGRLGLCGTGGIDMLVENNEIAFNNTDGFDPRWDGGGTKWVKTLRLTVRNNHSHDNLGPGLWTDGSNMTTVYEGNRVERNSEEGIFHEISYDAIIRNNVVLSNGRNIGTWGAGIMVSSSPNVQIYGNTVKGGWNGISLVQENRGSGTYGAFTLKNVTVSNNLVTMTKGSTGVFDTTGTGSVFKQGTIKFQSNNYTLSAGDQWFNWAGAKQTAKQWKALGMDKTGQFNSRRR